MEVASAEELVDLQKKRSALNLFFVSLSSRNKDSNPLNDDNEEPAKRNAGDSVVVSYLILFRFDLIFNLFKLVTEKKPLTSRFQNLHLRQK